MTMKSITTNWKTTLWGVVTGLFPGLLMLAVGLAGLANINIPGVSLTVTPWQLIQNALPFLSAGVLGLIAKDGDVTGGTKLAPAGYVKIGVVDAIETAQKNPAALVVERANNPAAVTAAEAAASPAAVAEVKKAAEKV